MQKKNQLFDDLAKLTKGYASILGEFKDELEHFVSSKFKKLVIDMQLVNRDDFDQGIDAVLVSKHHNPSWNPSSINDINQKHVNELFEFNSQRLIL